MQVTIDDVPTQDATLSHKDWVRRREERRKLYESCSDVSAWPERRWAVDGGSCSFVRSEGYSHGARTSEFKFNVHGDAISAAGYARIAELKRACERWLSGESKTLPPSSEGYDNA